MLRPKGQVQANSIKYKRGYPLGPTGVSPILIPADTIDRSVRSWHQKIDMCVTQAGGGDTCRLTLGLRTDVPRHAHLAQEPCLCPRQPTGSQPTCPSRGVGVQCSRGLTLDVPALLPHLVHQPLCGGREAQHQRRREGLAHSSECQPRHATLSRARLTTSCAFVDNLLDLGLLGCALPGLFGWWGRCVGSCLGFNPHVCVNFFVGVLLLWMAKAGNKVTMPN